MILSNEVKRCGNMNTRLHKNEEIIYVKKDEIIFSEIDKLEYVYYVLDGVVKVIKYTEEGKEKIIDILGKDDFLAVTLMMENKKVYGLSGIAINDCKLLKISVKNMFEALENPDILKQYMDFSFKKTLHFKNYIALSIDSDERVLLVLKELYGRFGSIENGDKVINLPISKSDLANFIGLRRETLSRKLSALKKEGIIDIDKNKIYLNDL